MLKQENGSLREKLQKNTLKEGVQRKRAMRNQMQCNASELIGSPETTMPRSTMKLKHLQGTQLRLGKNPTKEQESRPRGNASSSGAKNAHLTSAGEGPS